MRRNVKPHAVSQARRRLLSRRLRAMFSCGCSKLSYRWKLEAGGCWRGESGWEGRSEGVMQLLLLDAGPLWQQTSISEPARQPVISNMVGATDPRVV